MNEPSVDELMSRPVESVTQETTVAEAAETLIRNDVGAVVVTVDERLEGLVTATDFVLFAMDEQVPADTTVAQLMQTDVVTTNRDASIGAVAELMLDHLIHHVPVVDGEEVVGLLSTLDLTAYLAESRES